MGAGQAWALPRGGEGQPAPGSAREAPSVCGVSRKGATCGKRLTVYVKAAVKVNIYIIYHSVSNRALTSKAGEKHPTECQTFSGWLAPRRSGARPPPSATPRPATRRASPRVTRACADG